MRPNKVNILGIVYTIDYYDNPAEVDYNKRASLWGQVDYWERRIRIYDNGRPLQDILQTLLHEITHAIDTALYLKLGKENDMEEVVDLLSLALTDVMVRNEWIDLDELMGKDKK